MTDSTDQQVTVEHADLASVTADVLVIPSTTQGSFGEPWHSVVGRLGLLPSRSPIPFGEVRMEPVGARGTGCAMPRSRRLSTPTGRPHGRRSPGSVRRWDG